MTCCVLSLHSTSLVWKIKSFQCFTVHSDTEISDNWGAGRNKGHGCKCICWVGCLPPSLVLGSGARTEGGRLRRGIAELVSLGSTFLTSFQVKYKISLTIYTWQCRFSMRLPPFIKEWAQWRLVGIHSVTAQCMRPRMTLNKCEFPSFVSGGDEQKWRMPLELWPPSTTTTDLGIKFADRVLSLVSKYTKSSMWNYVSLWEWVSVTELLKTRVAWAHLWA